MTPNTCLSACLLVLFSLLSSRAKQGNIIWRCEPWRDLQVGNRTHRLDDKCYIFTSYDHKFKWKDAKTYCSKYGGTLAMDKTPRSHIYFDSELSSKSCLWFGLSYSGNKGKWIWIDGEEMSVDSKWDLGEIFFSFFKKLLVYECGAMCTDGIIPSYWEWIWAKKSCSTKLPTLCQYDAEEVQTADLTKEAETDVNMIRPKVTRIIELPKWRGYRLKDKPDWSTRTVLVTNCARRCQNSKDCTYFNFDRETRTCIGYVSVNLASQNNAAREESESGWTLWTIYTSE